MEYGSHSEFKACIYRTWHLQEVRHQLRLRTNSTMLNFCLQMMNCCRFSAQSGMIAPNSAGMGDHNILVPSEETGAKTGWSINTARDARGKEWLTSRVSCSSARFQDPEHQVRDTLIMSLRSLETYHIPTQRGSQTKWIRPPRVGPLPNIIMANLIVVF